MIMVIDKWLNEYNINLYYWNIYDINVEKNKIFWRVKFFI